MSGCEHIFEQDRSDRLIGTYATCSCCRRRTFAPEYASCIKCDRTMCVRCIIVVPLGDDDSDSDVWEEVTENEITDRFLIDVKQFMEDGESN